MDLTEEKLKQMDEKQLRTLILIPLFTAMGFQDVRHHHGALELGKDIIMWKSESLAERVNYVVVAKAKPISGKVTGKDGYSEVMRQIHQCFGSDYFDPKTLHDLTADRCIVVTSHAISKEAHSAMRGELKNSRLDKLVRFIDGTELWEHVQKYLGSRIVLSKLAEVQNTLNNIDPNFRLAVDTSKGKTSIIIEPKKISENAHTPLFLSKIAFTDDEPGKNAAKSFSDFLKKGTPIAIQGKHIKECVFPQSIQEVLLSGHKIDQIKFSNRPENRAFVADIEISHQNQKALITAVEFKMIRSGSEEVYFNNEHQKVPWKFAMTAHHGKESGLINFHSDYKGFNVNLEYQGVLFEQVLMLGGTISIVSRETGLPIGSCKAVSGHKGPPPEWLELLSKLVHIQKKTKTLFQIPENRVVSVENVIAIENVMEMITNGKIPVSVDDFNIPLSLEDAKELVSSNSDFEQVMTQKSLSYQILGKNVELGEAKVFLRGCKINPDSLAEAQKQIEEKCEVVTIRVTLAPNHGSEMSLTRWSNQND